MKTDEELYMVQSPSWDANN